LGLSSTFLIGLSGRGLTAEFKFHPYPPKRHANAMANTVPMIGIQTGELGWLRMLVQLLRHPDPNVGDLTRHALLYIADAAASGIAKKPLDHAG